MRILIKSFEISKMMLKMWQKEMGKLLNTGTKNDRRPFFNFGDCDGEHHWLQLYGDVFKRFSEWRNSLTRVVRDFNVHERLDFYVCFLHFI